MFRAAATTLLIFLVTAPAATAGANEDLATLHAMLENVRLMPGREHKAITVFPLVLDSGVTPESLGVSSLRSAVAKGRLSFAEPIKPARRWNVMVTSRSARSVLVPAGTILVGGRLDRMVTSDHVVPPGAQLQIPTLPAEYPRDERRGKDVPTAFRVSSRLAPHVLRQGAIFSPSLQLVPGFVSRLLDFRAPGDRRHSFESVAASPALARRVDADVAALANVPRIYEGRVIGWITVVGGRIHGLDLFGSNALAAAHFTTMLRAHAFTITALELRSEELGLRPPDPKALLDPERYRPQVEAFLDRVRGPDWRARSEGALRLRKHRSRGLAAIDDGRLIHAAAVLDLAFLERLHDRPLPPPPETVPHPAIGLLERSAVVDGRRNTAFEERLLERMKERRESR